MRVVFDAVTPAQVHMYKNIIYKLKNKGHDVHLYVRPAKSTLNLLNYLDLEYTVIGRHRASKVTKVIQGLLNVKELYTHLKKLNPDICVGQIYGIYAASFLKKPSIIFEDDEVTFFQQFLYVPFVNVIITPEMFNKNFGKKHIKIASYKELAYLHPKYFKPDDSIFDFLNLSKEDKYVIFRWNTWDAIHDVGKKGFDEKLIKKYIKKIEEFASVFISTERELPKSLDVYKINIPFHKIHDALYFANMLISDTQTMSTEAAILGTPTIRSNSFVGENDMSNFIELERKYKLMFNYRDPKKAIEKALELIEQPKIKDLWKKRREYLLKDKIDMTEFMVWFIENYPESFNIMKENPNYQERFK